MFSRVEDEKFHNLSAKGSQAAFVQTIELHHEKACHLGLLPVGNALASLLSY